MKRAIPWFILVGWVGVVAGYFLRGQHQPAVPASATPAGSQVPQAAGASTGPAAVGGTVVHTFGDETAVQAFAAMWQQRHNGLLRLGLLEGYWNDEQVLLGQLNRELSGQYGLDLADAAKSYLFDTDTRTIVERAAGTDTTPPSSSTENQQVIHTFTDDEAMKAFAKQWQARQMIVGRMDVLSGYWLSERRRMEDLNEQLATDYHVDVTKSYSFDQARRALVEHDAPPAPLPGALPQEKPAQPQAPDTQQNDDG